MISMGQELESGLGGLEDSLLEVAVVRDFSVGLLQCPHDM